MLNESQHWHESWNRHLAEYLQGFPRAGYALELLFPDRRFSFLELAGGSLRDTNYLARRGYRAVGSDFLPAVVQAAARSHANPRLQPLVLDAFATGLKDEAFDVTFHNGFWGLFDQDALRQLLAEQARITRHYLVALVHCGCNRDLRARFTQMAAHDELYAIRFFEPADLLPLLAPYGTTHIYAFGSPWSHRILPDASLGRLPLALRRFIFRHLCPWEPRSQWERILTVTRLYRPSRCPRATVPRERRAQ